MSGATTEVMPGAPPPARRSTLSHTRPRQVHSGSSARAEIDPSTCLITTLLSRLLRPRGDRPQKMPVAGHVAGAPPPARRSTPIQYPFHVLGTGSSARAEIDPCGSTVPPFQFRLLRPRGDRPAALSSRNVLREAPPPARRSTPDQACPEGLWRGSSARAEIDPVSYPPEAAAPRLLRPRGDRPGSALSFVAAGAAPPPAWRSTPIDWGRLPQTVGSSARAEIDPGPYQCRG